MLPRRNLLCAVSRSDGTRELITTLCRLLYRQKFLVYGEPNYDAYSTSRRGRFKGEKDKVHPRTGHERPERE